MRKVLLFVCLLAVFFGGCTASKVWIFDEGSDYGFRVKRAWLISPSGKGYVEPEPPGATRPAGLSPSVNPPAPPSPPTPPCPPAPPDCGKGKGKGHGKGCGRGHGHGHGWGHGRGFWK